MISLVGIQTSLTVVNLFTFLPKDFFGGNSNLPDSGKLSLPFYQRISLVGIQTSLTVVNFSSSSDEDHQTPCSVYKCSIPRLVFLNIPETNHIFSMIIILTRLCSE